jgi:hypothetical protein
MLMGASPAKEAVPNAYKIKVSQIHFEKTVVKTEMTQIPVYAQIHLQFHSFRLHLRATFGHTMHTLCDLSSEVLCIYGMYNTVLEHAVVV